MEKSEKTGTALRYWKDEDKPREKMKKYGVEVLTDAELLAIMLGSGTKDKNVVDLAKEILDGVGGDLNRLSELTLYDMHQRFKGIGDAKAMHILATLEFGRRRNAFKTEMYAIRNSYDVVRLMQPVLGDLPTEEFWVVLMNRRNKVIAKECIAKGGVSAVMVDIRTLLKPAITRLASAIIICHNHPSGSSEPSGEDRALTRKIKQAAELMDIKLLDHVIITGDADSFYSFADKGDVL